MFDTCHERVGWAVSTSRASGVLESQISDVLGMWVSIYK